MSRWRLDSTRLEDRLTPNAVPALVRDVNPLPENTGSNPNNFAELNGTIYFFATTPATGTELWRSDGTPGGTTLVRDIMPGSEGQLPGELISFQDWLYFTANDGDNGRELWRSDGTSQGTMLVKDLRPYFAGSGPSNFIVHGNMLYFSANGGSGYELCRHDGTLGQITLVKEINPAGSASPGRPTAFNGQLYFSANDGVNGVELWKTDGSNAGTALVRDLNPGSASGSPLNITAVGNRLQFRATDTVNGQELWTSDGTSLGTSLVLDINSGKNSAAITGITAVGNLVYFNANQLGFGDELWKSDGTAAGTQRVRDINAGTHSSSVNQIVNFGGQAVFRANDGVHGFELWTSDGTSAGTELLRDINPGPGSGNPTGQSTIDGKLIFFANDGTGTQWLWTSDGTAVGTVPVSTPAVPVLFSVSSAGFVQAGSTLYFAGNDLVIGTELYKTDGTAAGTALVRNLIDQTADANPTSFVRVGGTTYFTATGGTANGLWKTDGTSTGTSLVYTLPTNDAAYLTNVNGQLLFRSNKPGFGLELWRSDGTSAGTMLVKDIYPGATGSGLSQFTVVNGKLFFTANTPLTGTELWQSDGTSDGTMIVRELSVGTVSNNITKLTAAGDLLFFSAFQSASGTRLWRSDGTSAGTMLVDSVSTSPESLFNHQGILYYSASTSVTGRELWRSDGTTAGTFQIADIRPGNSTSNSDPANFATLRKQLYFKANDGVAGNRLLQYEPTNGILTRIDAPSASLVNVTGLTAVSDRLYFVANNALWKTDGTSTGTGLVYHLSQPISQLTNVAGTLYFQLNTGSNWELWRSDGTSGGTGVIPIDPAMYSNPILAASGNRLYLNAFRSDVGRELFAVNDQIAPRISSIESPSNNGAYVAGETVTIQVRFQEDVSLSGGSLRLLLDTGVALSSVAIEGRTATFEYQVGLGQTTAKLNAVSLSLGVGAVLTDLAGNAADLSLPAGDNLEDNNSLIINPLAPTTFASMIVNQGAMQRSRITEITLNFSAPVDAAQLARPGVITLRRTSGGNTDTVVQTSNAAPGTGVNRLFVAPSSGFVTSVKLSFYNPNPIGSPNSDGVEYVTLADGRWQISIPWLNYQSAPGDTNLRRLFGDADNSGQVDAVDLAAIGAAFGQTAPGSPFDYDNNSLVDANDFVAFGNRFGRTL